MKTVSIPVSKDAQKRLDLGKERKGDLIENTLSSDEFDVLFSSGWINEINATLGVNIDDFEDEHIIGQEPIRQLKEIAERYAADRGEEVFKIIASMSELGLQKGTGVHFYF